MPTYYKDTGSTGQMKIVDTGTTVEFWLTASSYTFDHEMPWRYYVNGAWTSYRNFDFTGGAWRKLGSVNVTTDQTVGFGIGDTGTAGLGGPTSFTVSVDRTSAPPAPGAWQIEQIWDTKVQGDTDSYGNGGLAIDEFQVRYDNNSDASSPSYFTPNSTAYGTITGLARGTTYYFWVRSHNAKGWSPWSARTSAKTHNLPPAPTAPVISAITQTSVHTRFSGNGDGGSAILEWQTGYAISGSSDAISTKSGYDLDITDLEPGVKYDFWGRGRNAYGWGAWSAVASATLYAGAWVNSGGVWKRAVPYVKYNGVWKVATPYVKIQGMWKGTG